MNEQIFPPSPNWYLTNAFACSSNGILAYGSRNNLVVIRTTGENTNVCIPKVEVIPIAHKERVTVVVFSSQNDQGTLQNCIATSGDDGVVKVWDFQTMSPILGHSSHGTGNKVICMDWSRANPDLIVSMDDNHNIVCWDLPSNSTRTLNLGKLSATTLSCCPHNKELIAIGCRSGLVCVVTIQGRGKVLFRMRGHDSEVVSLTWCPVGYNIFESLKAKSEKKSENQEFILASAAKERTIFLWRANSDGRYELTLSIPTHLMIGSRSNKGGVGELNWVSLCWPQANILISSTRLGRIIAWDLKASFNNKSSKNAGGGDSTATTTTRTWRLIHSSHSRIIFSIVSPCLAFDIVPETQDATNWRQSNVCDDTENPLVIWSSSQDRLIIGYDLNSNKEIATIPTLGGIVYCIAPSPIDPNRIAFGVSDTVIRIWNLSSSSAFDVTLLWQKVRGKVTSVAWHPTQESHLAFGTSEGRVGIFDTLNSNKPPVLLRPYHTRSLYVVMWGPALFGAGDGDGPSDTKYALYSCGEGDVVQYDIHNPEAEAKSLSELPQLNAASRKSLIRTDFSWKPDNSILALGNEDGSVQLITATNVAVLHTIYAHKNLVQSLAWHPEGTATDTGYSPCQHWLAIASKKSPIKVYNVASLLEGEETGDIECVAVFSRHKLCVVGMAWSPHVSGQLVSVSFDETAQVWDVLQQQPVGNYSYHAGVLHCVCWSPLDPDLVITGSADSTLRVWRISTLDRSVPSDKRKERTAAKKSEMLLFCTKNNVMVPEKEATTDDSANATPMPRIEVAANESETQSASKCVRQKNRSFFPVWAQMWQGTTSKMLARSQLYLKPEGISDSEPNLLGNRMNVLELLKLEENQHIHNDNLDGFQHIALWKGDVGEMIREMAKKKKLTDWLVSLAPLVSQRLWLDTCQMYAEQLTTEGRIHKATSYLLACHKVEEAIQLFLQHRFYREALTVAKLRLGLEDPVTTNIVRDWSQVQITDGHYEKASECLISLGDLLGAAEILGKRNDPQCLWLAADIANKSKSEPVAQCYAKNCIIQCLLHKNWELALQVTSQYLELQPWTLLIFTHQSICELLAGMFYIQEPLPFWINQQYKKQFEKDPKQFYDILEKTMERNVPDTKSNLWLAVSGEVALSSCAADEMTTMRHLVYVANVCYQYQLMHPHVFPLSEYLRWLAPKDVLDENSIFKMESQDENIMLLRKSLRFYLYAGYFCWLQNEFTVSETKPFNDKDNNEHSIENETSEAKSDQINRTEENSPSDKIEVDKSETEIADRLETISFSEEKIVNDGCGDQLTSSNDSLQKFDWIDLMVPLLTSYSNEIPLEASSLLYYKQKVEIKKWEQEVASLVAQHRQISEEIKIDEETDETKMLKGLQILDELKYQKETFEKQRVSTPNPFVTYCHFKSICDYLIKEKNMEDMKLISETAVNNWAKATDGIK